MGGGTPLLEAKRVGCHVVGADINPMAYWIVRQELAELDRTAFRATADDVMATVEAQIGHLDATTCRHCGNDHAQVKYFLWVKQHACASCNGVFDLFPHYELAKNQRYPRYVLLCPACGQLTEVDDVKASPPRMRCATCQGQLQASGPARRNRCPCPHCGRENRYPNARQGSPAHRLFALEYHCPICAPTHRGRFFKACTRFIPWTTSTASPARPYHHNPSCHAEAGGAAPAVWCGTACRSISSLARFSAPLTRIPHLAEIGRQREAPGQPRLQVIACIDGRGFGVRRAGMRKLFEATRGKVFTLRTLDSLVASTELRRFASIS